MGEIDMKAHVICMNDSVEFVVIDDEAKAEEVKEELAKSYYERQPWRWSSYEEYQHLCFWHLHTVDAL